MESDAVVMTGNTVVDALHWLERERPEAIAEARDRALGSIRLDGRRLAVVTGHRRESFGGPFRDFCRALLEGAERHPDLHFVYPVHLNPQVQAPVRALLLVTRERTERVEGVEAGVSVLVGTDPERIGRALDDALVQGRGSRRENPFGDGQAARRGADAMLERFGD